MTPCRCGQITRVRSRCTWCGRQASRRVLDADLLEALQNGPLSATQLRQAISRGAGIYVALKRLEGLGPVRQVGLAPPSGRGSWAMCWAVTDRTGEEPWEKSGS